MQYIRKALRALQDDAAGAGIDARYALASQHLYKHGAKVLVDFSKEDDQTRRLFELVSRNMVFTPVVEGHLERITYGEDGWASRLVLPSTPAPLVCVDPIRAAGQPLTIRPSTRRNQKPPDRLPELFVDRSLGRLPVR